VPRLATELNFCCSIVLLVVMHKLVQLTVTISVASASQASITSEGKIIRSEGKVGDGNNRDGSLSLKEFEHPFQELGSNEDDNRHGSTLDEEHRDLSKVAQEDHDGNDDAQDSENGDNTNDEDDDDMKQRDYEVDADLDSTERAQISENDDTPELEDDPVKEPSRDLPVDNATLQKLQEETALDDSDDST